MTGQFDLVVIGAGVHGGTVALFAARAGMKVALIERDQVCRGASGVNAGTLTMQMTRVALIPYAMRAHAMWANARDWLGREVGVVVCEGLSLAFTEQEEEILSFRAGKRREAGAPIDIVTGVQAKAIEPGLSADVRIAGHCTVDGYANAYLTGLAYRAALIDAGVHLSEQTTASGIDRTAQGFVVHTSGGAIAGTRLVVAGGAWIEPMLAWLGLRVPITVLTNQLSATERIAPVMRTQVGIASGLLSLKQYPHGTVVIGGGWQGRGDPDTGRTELVAENIVGNIRLACHAIPALRAARLARCWAGFEAETADALPAAGALPGIADAYVCGSVHSGYTSGPYIAKLLADRILGRAPEMPLFPIERLLTPAANTDRPSDHASASP